MHSQLQQVPLLKLLRIVSQNINVVTQENTITKHSVPEAWRDEN